MTSTIDDLIRKIKSLEIELIEEIQSQQNAFTYEIKQRHIVFEKTVIQQHKQYVQQLLDYLQNASIKHVLSAPVIWMVLMPAFLLDITVTLYQSICFPIYGIPKVKRTDYIVFDRQSLNYLNIIEKINCAYCSYFNGVTAYILEIAARTEQFWCPIKHAQHISNLHSRYQHFLDYGDAKAYREEKERIRKDFDDLRQ